MPANAAREARLGRMQLHEVVGSGARSVVYRATLGPLTYVVKMYEGLRDQEQAERVFRREAAIHASLRHPAIPTIHEVGVRDDKPYIISEYVQGRTLSEVLSAGPMGPIAAVRIGRAIADALAEVHRHGIVHRDVKPGNILLAEGGDIKLIDFGLAGHAVDTPADEGAGTFRYSAPEQIGLLERPVDGRADLYALGVVLFECVVGHPPFTSQNTSELFHQHAAVPPPRIHELDPSVGLALSAIVDKLLRKDPDERYRSAEELQRDLENVSTLDQIAASGGEPLLSVARTRRPPRGCFVGRHAELGRLLDATRAAFEGQGRILLVEGAAGSGKSRLVEELLHSHIPESAPILRGKCAIADPYPFAALREALEGWMVEVRAPGQAARVAAARQAGKELAPVLRQFDRRLGDLLGAEANAPAPRDAREVFYNALSAFLIALSDTHHGAVLWLDDVQWLDEASHDALLSLASQVAGHPFVLVLSGRNDDDSAPAMERLRRELAPLNATRLPIGPLEPTAVAEIVRTMLGCENLDDGFTRAISSRSQGNPLIVWQYVQAMKDAGVLIPHWGSWVVESGSLNSVELPTEIYDLMTRRISWLRPEARDVLEAAALLGSRFGIDLLCAAAAPTPRRAVQRAISDGIEARLIERADSPGELSFVHDRIRESLGRARDIDARIVHDHAAQWLDSLGDIEGRNLFEFARHAMLGWAGTRPVQTFHACLAAARVANAEHASARAYELLEFASTVTESSQLDAPVRLEFHREMGLASFATHRIEDAARHFTAAIELSTERYDRANLRAWLARATIFSFDTRTGIQHIEAAFEELGEELPSRAEKHPEALRARLIALMQSHLAVVQAGKGFGAAQGEARRHAETLIELADVTFLIGYYDRNQLLAMQGGVLGLLPAWQLGDCAESGQGFSTFAMLMGLLSRQDAVVRFGDLALNIVRKLGDRHALATTQSKVAIARHFCGDVDEALRMQREVFEKYGAWLGPLDFQNCCIDLSWNYFVRGQVDDEQRVHTEARRRLDAAEGPFMGAYRCRASAGLMAVTATLGDGASSSAMAGVVQEHRGLVPAERTIPWMSVEGYLVLSALQLDDTSSTADEAIARHRAWGIPPERSALHAKHFYIGQAWLALERYRTAPAPLREDRLAHFAAAVDELNAAATVPTVRAHLLTLQGTLTWLRGDEAGALSLADDAHSLALDYHNPWVLAEVALLRARIYRGRQKTDTSAALASHARQLAWRHNWRRLSRRVDAEFQTAPTTSAPTMRRSGASHTAERGNVARLQVQLEGMLALSRATATVLDPDVQARIALDEIIQLMGAERAFLFIIDEERGWLRFARGRNARREDLGEPTAYSRTIVERVHATGRPVVLASRSDAATLESESVLAYDLRSVLSAPLVGGDRVLGVIYLDNRLAHGVFTEDHVEILHALANHIASALQTARAAQLEARLKAETERRRLADTLRDIVTSLTSTLNLKESLDRLVDALKREIRFDRAIIAVRDTSGMAPTVFSGLEEEDAHAFLELPPVAEAISFLSEQRVFHVARGTRTAACMLFPLRSRELIIGYVLLIRDANVAPEDLELGAMLVGQASIAIENARLFRRIRALAEKDELTGLWNRREFFRRAELALSDAVDADAPLATLMFDVDHFKKVNDRHGHATGDDLLRAVAEASQRAVRQVDVLARYGGEEFAVVLPGASRRQAVEVAERVRAAVADVHLTGPTGEDLNVTVSVGVATRQPGDDLGAMLSRADRALYLSKSRGRNRVSIMATDTT